jgi:hypothetical protein
MRRRRPRSPFDRCEARYATTGAATHPSRRRACCQSRSPIRHAVAIGVRDNAIGDPLLGGIHVRRPPRPNALSDARPMLRQALPQKVTALMSAHGRTSDPVSPAHGGAAPHFRGAAPGAPERDGGAVRMAMRDRGRSPR